MHLGIGIPPGHIIYGGAGGVPAGAILDTSGFTYILDTDGNYILEAA